MTGEDCEDCGKTPYIANNGLCKDCEEKYYSWDEGDYYHHQAFYEYEGKIQLDKLEELPYKEKIGG